MTPGMCSRQHYVLVMSSLSKLQSLRSSPWCQSRLFGQVESALKASLSNFHCTGHYLSQWRPQYVVWQLSCFMPTDDCIRLTGLELCRGLTCEGNSYQSGVQHEKVEVWSIKTLFFILYLSRAWVLVIWGYPFILGWQLNNHLRAWWPLRFCHPCDNDCFENTSEISGDLFRTHHRRHVWLMPFFRAGHYRIDTKSARWVDAAVYLRVIEPIMSLWRFLRMPFMSAPPLFNKRESSGHRMWTQTKVFVLFTEESLASSLTEHMEIRLFDGACNHTLSEVFCLTRICPHSSLVLVFSLRQRQQLQFGRRRQLGLNTEEAKSVFTPNSSNTAALSVALSFELWRSTHPWVSVLQENGSEFKLAVICHMRPHVRLSK